MADAVRQAVVFSTAGLACFGVGLLGGLGTSAAAQASLAYERKSAASTPAALKDEASIQATGSVISAVFYFTGLLAFFFLLMYSTMRR